MVRLYMSATAFVLTVGPAFGQSSWPTTLGSTPAPALGIPTITPAIQRPITLGIAAAATANISPATASAADKTDLAANTSPGRFRSSTR